MLDLLDHVTLSFVLQASDIPRPVPEDSEVRAGYVALALWIGMGVAVALLGWSMIRQIRKVTAANEAGVYDDPNPAREELESPEDDPQD